jgi:PhnB protein
MWWLLLYPILEKFWSAECSVIGSCYTDLNLWRALGDFCMTAIPYLTVRDAAAAIEFYQNALGATEFVRLADVSGKVMHAEMRIGDARIMLADEFPDMGYRSPSALGGSPVSILLYVEDVDRLFALAIEMGATSVMPVQDHFDGDRRGTLSDPFGHTWLIATKKEEVPLEELKKRFEAMLNQDSK